MSQYIVFPKPDPWPAGMAGYVACHHDKVFNHRAVRLIPIAAQKNSGLSSVSRTDSKSGFFHTKAVDIDIETEDVAVLALVCWTPAGNILFIQATDEVTVFQDMPYKDKPALKG